MTSSRSCAPFLLGVLVFNLCEQNLAAQSADWQEVVFREPQVRYLLADMTGGGNVDMYRKYATEERDPDSREAIRRWDAGVRVVNMASFQRGWIANPLAKDGRAFRVTYKGTSRTIHGDEVLLTSDYEIDQATLRLILLELNLGSPQSEVEARYQSAFPATNETARPQSPTPRADISGSTVKEALRLWDAGVRVNNLDWFEVGNRKTGGPNFRGTNKPADGFRVRLNSDVPYPEVNVRYFMADVALGGSIEFYRKVAEDAHEMGCLEAVRRIEQGYRITNVDEFERKKVAGKVVITRKGSDIRISGWEVKLNSDIP